MTGVARRRPSPVLWLWHGMIVLGWALILSGLGLLLWECLLWLLDGFWTPSSLADIWLRSPLGEAYDAGRWEELQGVHLILHRILHWLGRIPTSFALVGLGLALAWFGNGWLAEVQDAPARHRRPPTAR